MGTDKHLTKSNKWQDNVKVCEIKKLGKNLPKTNKWQDNVKVCGCFLTELCHKWSLSYNLSVGYFDNSVSVLRTVQSNILYFSLSSKCIYLTLLER